MTSAEASSAWALSGAAEGEHQHECLVCQMVPCLRPPCAVRRGCGRGLRAGRGAGEAAGGRRDRGAARGEHPERADRSEERRVGKEGRARWWREHEKKK